MDAYVALKRIKYYCQSLPFLFVMVVARGSDCMALLRSSVSPESSVFPLQSVEWWHGSVSIPQDSEEVPFFFWPSSLQNFTFFFPLLASLSSVCFDGGVYDFQPWTLYQLEMLLGASYLSNSNFFLLNYLCRKPSTWVPLFHAGLLHVPVTGEMYILQLLPSAVPFGWKQGEIVQSSCPELQILFWEEHLPLCLEGWMPLTCAGDHWALVTRLCVPQVSQ